MYFSDELSQAFSSVLITRWLDLLELNELGQQRRSAVHANPRSSPTIFTYSSQTFRRTAWPYHNICVGSTLGPTHERGRKCSERQHDAAPMFRPVGPVVAGLIGGETNERRLGRTRRGRRTSGCSRVGRPPRTPSIDIEIKEEQQVVD